MSSIGLELLLHQGHMKSFIQFSQYHRFLKTQKRKMVCFAKLFTAKCFLNFMWKKKKNVITKLFEILYVLLVFHNFTTKTVKHKISLSLFVSQIQDMHKNCIFSNLLQN